MPFACTNDQSVGSPDGNENVTPASIVEESTVATFAGASTDARKGRTARGSERRVVSSARESRPSGGSGE
ncbi:hypothetical protein GCM10009037_30120 [Halarchaeum grantii]|uniref:Uncharacterized protein n=1 Tax=Halarchaeum grantii TaxID=1193105 RepID=A0A830FE66_9EURY|nr:hypothetical protein GCM10009037_30120 [Halarchaeum grantii]